MNVRIALAVIIIGLVLAVPAVYQIYQDKKQQKAIRPAHFVWIALGFLIPAGIGVAVYYS